MIVIIKSLKLRVDFIQVFGRISRLLFHFPRHCHVHHATVVHHSHMFLRWARTPEKNPGTGKCRQPSGGSAARANKGDLFLEKFHMLVFSEEFLVYWVN